MTPRPVPVSYTHLDVYKRQVLASLWRVDDRATRMLMEHFYRSLRQHPPPQALQRAQAALRAADRGAWSAPRYWAGFIVAGRSVNAMATRH